MFSKPEVGVDSVEAFGGPDEDAFGTSDLGGVLHSGESILVSFLSSLCEVSDGEETFEGSDDCEEAFRGSDDGEVTFG